VQKAITKRRNQESSIEKKGAGLCREDWLWENEAERGDKRDVERPWGEIEETKKVQRREDALVA